MKKKLTEKCVAVVLRIVNLLKRGKTKNAYSIECIFMCELLGTRSVNALQKMSVRLLVSQVKHHMLRVYNLYEILILQSKTFTP